ncbi:hypothetical protein Tco_0204245 [Tanacetum coccineum]
MYGHNHWQRDKGGTSRNAESQTVLIDAAVKKAHTDLLVAGESVTAWRVSQAALVMLKADCVRVTDSLKDKNEAKTDKTKHGNRKSVKSEAKDMWTNLHPI